MRIDRSIHVLSPSSIGIWALPLIHIYCSLTSFSIFSYIYIYIAVSLFQPPVMVTLSWPSFTFVRLCNREFSFLFVYIYTTNIQRYGYVTFGLPSVSSRNSFPLLSYNMLIFWYVNIFNLALQSTSGLFNDFIWDFLTLGT